jgi:cytochrome P450
MQIEDRDYFTDRVVLKDPYDYFAALYSKNPVYQPVIRDVMFVTGFEEAIEVLRNTTDFSSVIAVTGAGVPLPFKPTGDDINEQLEQHRHEVMGSDILVTYDGPRHSSARSLLTSLFVPSRLKANQAYMEDLADKMMRDTVARGKCELIQDVAVPYVTLVIADLLGVPADDREAFREVIAAGPPPGNIDAADNPHSGDILEHLARYFVGYVMDRRANPRGDVLTQLATAKYSDGTTPELRDIVALAVFLFAAGQDTSAKLIGNCLRFLTDDPALQQRLRQDRSQVPAFIEEVLRLQGSTKVTFRVARRKTRIGGQEIAAGQRLVIALAAANRDPRRWEEPNEFKLGRKKAQEHLAFGRGAHTCIGAPLARAEVKVLLDRLLLHTSDISLAEEKHGPPGNRRLDYEASFIIRGLENLHLELKPASSGVSVS